MGKEFVEGRLGGMVGSFWVCVGGREKIVGKVWLRTGEVEVFWVVPLRLNKVIDALTHPDE